MAGDSAYQGGDRAGGLPAGSRVAAYRIEARAGAGGMAVVYRARDERLGRTVALKVLAPALAADTAFRQRFIRESRAAAAVDHPNILPVYEADEAGGLLFIAMRFVSGGDLQSLAAREAPMPAARAAGFVAAAASALDAAHAAGLVHRDVKPANVLVDSRPGQPDHLYLSDFGLTKGLALASVTAPSEFFGTPDYIAPELVAGTAVDHRADQYALACMAFRLLAGVPVFEREHSAAVLLAHATQPPPSVNELRPDLPPAAGQVLARALAKQPGDRYPSCGAFAAALSGALDPSSRAAAPSLPASPPVAVAGSRALVPGRAAAVAPGASQGGAPPAGPGSVVAGQGGAGAPPGAVRTRRRRRGELLVPAVVAVVVAGALAAAVVLVGNSHGTGSAHVAAGGPGALGGTAAATATRPGKSPTPQADKSPKSPSPRADQSAKAENAVSAAASAPAAVVAGVPPGKASPPARATAVSVGGAGPSASGAVASLASTLSWDQAVSGSSPALLVAVSVGEVPDSGMTASVTDNGAAMTSLATVQTADQPDGFLEVFGLAGVADGTNAIKVTVAGGRAQEITGGSVSFDGAATFSAPATAYGISGTPAVSVASRSGGVIAAFSACGSTIEGTASPASQEFVANDDDESGAGNSAGATSAATGGQVTVAWSAVSDSWGAVAVEVDS